MGFSKQEYCSGLPCPLPGSLPHTGINPVSLAPPALAFWMALAGHSLSPAPPGKPMLLLLLLLLFSSPVLSDSLQSHGLQHARPPYPLPSPKVCPSSCPLHRWCHPAISSWDALSSFCLQSFPASGTFPIGKVVQESVVQINKYCKVINLQLK